MKKLAFSFMLFVCAICAQAQNVAIDKASELTLPYERKTAIMGFGFEMNLTETGSAEALKEKASIDNDIVLLGKVTFNPKVTVVLYALETRKGVEIKVASFVKGKLAKTEVVGKQYNKSAPATFKACKKDNMLLVSCQEAQEGSNTPLTKIAKINEKGELSVGLGE